MAEQEGTRRQPKDREAVNQTGLAPRWGPAGHLGHIDGPAPRSRRAEPGAPLSPGLPLGFRLPSLCRGPAPRLRRTSIQNDALPPPPVDARAGKEQVTVESAATSASIAAASCASGGSTVIRAPVPASPRAPRACLIRPTLAPSATTRSRRSWVAGSLTSAAYSSG